MDKQKSKPKTDDTSCPACELMAGDLVAERKTAADNLELAKYHKAEFENFRRRNAETASTNYASGKEVAVLQILPLLDALHEGLRTVETQNDREGLEMIVRKFGQTLTSLGVTEIEAAGAKFDPRLHNAVAVEPAQKGQLSDVVVEVWQHGYVMDGRVIRPSTVKVRQ